MTDEDCPVTNAITSGVQSLRRLSIGGRSRDRVAVDTHAIPVIDPDGVVLGAVLILHDASSETSLEERCQSLHMTSQLGRVEGEIRFQREASFTRQSRAEIPGRMVLDAIPLVRDTIRLQDYRLETAARSILGRGKLIDSEVPDAAGIVTPMVESRLFPDRSLAGPDPRDGTNYLAGIYQVGAPSRERGRNPLAMPNGLSDVVELGVAGSLMDMGFMYEDPTPRANEVDEHMTAVTVATLQALFGERVAVRFGAYAATPGIHRNQQDVALDFVEQGYTRLILTRETTDNNQYGDNQYR